MNISDVALGGVNTAGAVAPASSRVASLATSLLLPDLDLRARLLADFDSTDSVTTTSLLVSAVLSVVGFFERELREGDFAVVVSNSASLAGTSLAVDLATFTEVFEAALVAVALVDAFLATDADGFRSPDALALEAGFELASSEFETGAFDSMFFTISGVLQAAYS